MKKSCVGDVAIIIEMSLIKENNKKRCKNKIGMMYSPLIIYYLFLYFLENKFYSSRRN